MPIELPPAVPWHAITDATGKRSNRSRDHVTDLILADVIRAEDVMNPARHDYFYGAKTLKRLEQAGDLGSHRVFRISVDFDSVDFLHALHLAAWAKGGLNNLSDSRQALRTKIARRRALRVQQTVRRLPEPVPLAILEGDGGAARAADARRAMQRADVVLAVLPSRPDFPFLLYGEAAAARYLALAGSDEPKVFQILLEPIQRGDLEDAHWLVFDLRGAEPEVGPFY